MIDSPAALNALYPEVSERARLWSPQVQMRTRYAAVLADEGLPVSEAS